MQDLPVALVAEPAVSPEGSLAEPVDLKTCSQTSLAAAVAEALADSDHSVAVT